MGIKFTVFLLSFMALFTQSFYVGQSVRSNDKVSVTVPAASSASDPWFIYHEGMYYYCYAYGEGVAVSKSENIYDLFSAPRSIVYELPDEGMYKHNLWAPELHYLNGEWYVYFAADDGRNENHRMYVLKGTSQDPTQPFEMVGKISDPSDKWAIDGTVLEYNDEMYFIWSGWEGDTDGEQRIYIAHMSSPTQIDSERTLISKADYFWEKKGMPLNEGPEILKKDGNVYLVYSASGSWTDNYCLGLMKLTSSDPMKKSSWAKSNVPVFRKGHGVYGPGHASFITAKDGSDYIVYHGNAEKGTSWNGRNGRIQKFTWLNGFPVFGKPVRDGTKVEFVK